MGTAASTGGHKTRAKEAVATVGGLAVAAKRAREGFGEERLLGAPRAPFAPRALLALILLCALNAQVSDAMPFAQFVSLALPFMVFTSPQLVQLALVHGKPAGFVVCLPEINEAMGAWNGRLGLRGFVRFVRRCRHIRTAAFKLIGVMPEYRGTGLHAGIILAVIDGVREAGYERVDGSLIDERNTPMRSVVEGIGMSVYRSYRFFQADTDAVESR